ncbi:MAG: hypothetical protein OK456_02525 [Thaumarchaeota archaeon]|nr:hypothetical protein [Nitrososphaerota archaeon]
MPKSAMTLKEYLKELGENKKEKPDQVKEALDIYIGLWEEVIKKGIVAQNDSVDAALVKLEPKGGLYRAASETLPS